MTSPYSNRVIRKQIEKIDFGFYTDDDVRARSVCEVTSSVSIDTLGTSIPNGLYDPRMGPTTADSPPCQTCALGYLECPGHFGHIEMCVPVYHPLLFGKMLELLRVKCFNCHKLRIPKRQMKVYEAKFRLLKAGRYIDALELDDRMAAAMKKISAKGSSGKGGVSIQSAGVAVDNLLDETMVSLPSMSDNSHKLSTLEEGKLRDLVRQVVADCKGNKSCSHCGAYSPKIRQDSSNKVFQAALPAYAKRMNDAEGISIQPALTNGKEQNIDDDMEEGNPSSESVDEAVSSSRDTYMHASEVQAQVSRTWESSPEMCNALFSVQGREVFFLQAVAVPPNRFRPPMHLGGMVVEHGQNQYLTKILQSNELVRSNFASNSEALAYKFWIDLQTHVNCYMDSAKDPSLNKNTAPGIRQLLERKEGMFRKHMMGKRVNFCCRSVISPDPYIGTNEIGIPRHFVETLTYPTPVTDINIEEMRRIVERGPKKYPGARWVEFPDRRVDLSKMDSHQREATAARLLSHARKGGKPAIVGRQMKDGDMVLMNRQPSLHKPSIMAHEVRVLHNPTQKTIRMHYANCNTYNADFDGDEMNCHFPQSDLARAEAEYIAKTDLQFIVPTDGSPLRGLIQDHVIAGVKLTKRDTFLEKWEYQQLLFAALASLPRLELIRSDSNIEMLPPAILKPKPLWTGKQVISTLLNHLRKGNDRDVEGSEVLPGISTERKAKTPGTAFGIAAEEHLVIIRDGELLRGVLDKAAFGATDFCLVHAVFEAYGPEKAGLLLNSLGRLFTAYIQYFSGHSCRMEDLVLTSVSDQTRRDLVKATFNVGSRAAKAWADSEGGKVAIEFDELKAEDPLKPVEAAAAASKVRQLLSGSEGQGNSAAFDGFMMSKLNPLASDIVKACLPDGLAVPFPINTFGIMVTTGAKGSIVNQSQVSCSLGQQALEGRRVPRMSSGRTLPSFAPYDVNPRADGFVMDRFLTGVRPQEYYFHCMAGREGLVDTAVKTSRSGYLQRCLVKHLEELKVCYDYTVRNGEGGVVQFLYGEDGLDPTKSSYLDCTEKSFEYMARNHESLSRRQRALDNASIDLVSKDVDRSESLKENSTLEFQVGDHVRARRLRIGSEWRRGALCEGWHDATIIKKHKKHKADLKYLDDGQIVKSVPFQVDFGRNNTASSTCVIVTAATPDPIISSTRSHRLGTSGACVSERLAGATSSHLRNSTVLKKALESTKVTPKDFGSLVAAKYGAALCAPGEAVGAIAAQSIGEPSTQMTLNTFHLAGAGANVTLGIPRLREIIMTASRQLKTPTMSVPLNDSVSDSEALKLTRSFKKLSLGELVAGRKGISVQETLLQDDGGQWQRSYFVTIKFHPAERIKTAFGIDLNDIAKIVATNFVPALAREMKLELRRSATDGDGTISVQGGEGSPYAAAAGQDNEEGMDDSPGSEEIASLFDDEADDDDVSSDGNDAEDGVNASKSQQQSYGDKDDDEKSTSSTDSSNGSDSDDDNENAPKSSQSTKTSSESDLPVSTSMSSLKVDAKNNSIQLRPLRIDPTARPLLMVGLVEKAASKTLVRSRKNIDSAFINDEEGRGRCLQTAGINFSELWRLEKIDHSRLMSNDIWAIRCSYGVEAARNTIVEQIRSVFGVYGIEVDPRHLSLIADYMTFSGGYTAMNRTGMREMSSPFLQMSFETTAQFLTQAALTGSDDRMESPSANIVVGRPIKHGTGAFSLLVK
ncbi:unnamed protein product [Cylindrotheca closterium]|uniref:DNA-directed RNA polymerase subunit n=1 Tax=Cylindrotheca closterium TaxID=2856 RepID=A0AAD2FXD6_9STRA|nr:unnamed protein product [Cylindrotheca closterium]